MPGKARIFSSCQPVYDKCGFRFLFAQGAVLQHNHPEALQ
jgi:hypothetical protein